MPTFEIINDQKFLFGNKITYSMDIIFYNISGSKRVICIFEPFKRSLKKYKIRACLFYFLMRDIAYKGKIKEMSEM